MAKFVFKIRELETLFHPKTEGYYREYEGAKSCLLLKSCEIIDRCAKKRKLPHLIYHLE